MFDPGPLRPWRSSMRPRFSILKTLLEAIEKLKVEELKKTLRDRGQPVTGKKADLVLRCQVLFERPKTPSSARAKECIIITCCV